MSIDPVSFAIGQNSRKGGGGERAVLRPVTITKNGVHIPQIGVDGFLKVVADVANSYGEPDEGKVVKAGTLQVQSDTVVKDLGEYDTSTIKKVTVALDEARGRRY